MDNKLVKREGAQLQVEEEKKEEVKVEELPSDHAEGVQPVK